MNGHDYIFTLPLLPDRHLLHAPLSRFSAVVNDEALRQLQQCLSEKRPPATPALKPVYDQLVIPECEAPRPRSGPLVAPRFLGLLPTRSCNMACVYCDFAAPRFHDSPMTLSLARAAVDAYLHLLEKTGYDDTQIHFFGGEPFFAFDIVQFTVEYARQQAGLLGRRTHFEATTNGLYPPTRARWIAANFDAIVLSLDGPPDVLNAQRPGRNGRSVAEQIVDSAQIFAASGLDLILRACVTADTVARLPEIAAWMADHFDPTAICFETLIPTALTQASGLHPPDPWTFSLQFLKAAELLEARGIKAVLSTAETNGLDVSFCPVGHDALIVSPDGQVNACYQLVTAWQAAGLDMHLGTVDEQERRFIIDEADLQQVRGINVNKRPECAHCFCRWTCAGGCHISNNAAGSGANSDTCIQTRLITAVGLLQEMEQEALGRAWLNDETARITAVQQKDDRLLTLGHAK